MSKSDSARLDSLLDWLADEVAARLRAHAGATPPPGSPQVQAPPPAAPRVVATESAANPAHEVEKAPPPATPPEGAHQELQPEDAPPDRPSLPSHAAQLMGRLAIGLLVAVVLINIPLSRGGLALARMIPSSNPLVIRDGLLVKEADEPHVYVYRGGQFHWVTDLAAFEHFGYRWENVREVPPGFLAGYEIGRPIYLLAKCPGSPHIFRLENGTRRWIVDIASFEAEGYVWADVRTIDCFTLRSMPEGETIPPGRGPAPEP